MKSGWTYKSHGFATTRMIFSPNRTSEIMIFFTKKKGSTQSLPSPHQLLPKQAICAKAALQEQAGHAPGRRVHYRFIMGIRVSYKEFLSDDFGNVNKNFTMMTLKCFTSALSTNTPNTPQVSAKLEALTTKRISQWWLWTSFDSAWSINSPCRFC